MQSHLFVHLLQWCVACWTCLMCPAWCHRRFIYHCWHRGTGAHHVFTDFPSHAWCCIEHNRPPSNLSHGIYFSPFSYLFLLPCNPLLSVKDSVYAIYNVLASVLKQVDNTPMRLKVTQEAWLLFFISFFDSPTVSSLVQLRFSLKDTSSCL